MHSTPPEGISVDDWNDQTGVGAVLRQQVQDGDPPWAGDLRPCPPGHTCAARLELLSIAEALRKQLLIALAHPGTDGTRAAPSADLTALGVPAGPADRT